MQKINSLLLPTNFPTLNAIKSCKDNLCGYEPEFWEFFYEANRYLERVDIETLSERYRALLRNLTCLSSKERDVIPRQSTLSSWYWFIKEHQTRYEFFLRGEPLPVEPPAGVVCNEHVDAPLRPRTLNGTDVIFRNCKQQHAISLVERGGLRIWPASKYSELEGDKARADDELNKSVFWSGAKIKITTQSGNEIPVLGNFERLTSMHDYYTYCTSCNFVSELKNECGGACVVINDVAKFSNRLNNAINKILDNWYDFHCPVQYYDPYDCPPNQQIDTAMYKDFKFAYQQEYRFIWIHMEGVEAAGYLDLELGCLSDIAQLL